MKFLQVYCYQRERTVFIDSSKIVLLEDAIIAEKEDKPATFIYLDKDYDGKGYYSVLKATEEIAQIIESK